VAVSVVAEAIVSDYVFGWMEWDVTNHVKDAVREGLDNVDFIIRFETENESSSSIMDFYSKEGLYEDEDRKPKLVLNGGNIIQVLKDSAIAEGNPNFNQGDLDCLKISNTSADGTTIRSIASFSLSEISHVAVAKLRLYCSTYYNASPAGKSVQVYKCAKSDWVEDEVNWNVYKSGSAWSASGGDVINEVNDLPDDSIVIEIRTPEELYNVRKDLYANYMQMANIDMSSYVGWTEINAVDGDEYDIPFSGSYNGNNYNISGLNGLLFKQVTGTLSNINLTEFNNTSQMFAGIALGSVGTIQNCRVTGENNLSGSIVTIAGQNGNADYENAVVENCLVDVEGKTDGAMVGICYRNDAYIKKCSLRGFVYSESTENNIGICLCLTNYGNMEDCYGILSIDSPNEQFICVAFQFANISNCYVIGNFLGTGSKFIGAGIYGSPEGVINSYYNAVTGSTTYYGTSKSEVDLKQQSTFSGWDFSTVWSINSAANDGYPYLQWENLVVPVKEVLPSYVPQSVIELVFCAGDSEEYSMGKFYVDKTQYKVNTASLKVDGRNSIGKYLKDQSFDEACKFDNMLVSDMLKSILDAAGLTDYYVQPSTVYMGMEFAPNKSVFDGIEEIIQYLPGWQIREEVSGKVVIAEKTDSHFTRPSRYTFQRNRDIFSRDIVTDDRSVYGRVCVHTSDFLVKVWRPVTSNLGWNSPPKKTYYHQVLDGTTSLEAADIATDLAEAMSNSGAVETLIGPFRPQLIPGDEAEILEADATKTLIGVNTSIKFTFGDKGFTTENTVDSGGRIGKLNFKDIVNGLKPLPTSKKTN